MRKPIKQSKRFAVFNRDNHTCQYCGKKAPGVALEIDHKVPVSRGGDNSMDNLITSCFDCNRGKGSRELQKTFDPNSPESRMRLLNIFAMMHFKDLGHNIKPELSRQIIKDLLVKCKLSIGDVMIAIASNDDPQNFLYYCLVNYYHALIGGGAHVRN